MTWYNAFLHQSADRLFSMDVSPCAYPVVFVGGLLTNLCPCNVMLIPMVIGCVGGFSRTRERGRALLYSAMFSAGIVATFCLLGALASVIGSFIAPFRILCLCVLAGVALLMGFFCLGLVRFWLPGIGRPALQERMKAGGPWTAFLLGAVAGVVATPCTTPVLAVILTYVAVRARLMYGLSLLLTYSVGFIVPLLLAGAFTGFLVGLKKLQEKTGYQEWVRKLSGATLLLFGVYLLWQAASS